MLPSRSLPVGGVSLPPTYGASPPCAPAARRQLVPPARGGRDHRALEQVGVLGLDVDELLDVGGCYVRDRTKRWRSVSRWVKVRLGAHLERSAAACRRSARWAPDPACGQPPQPGETLRCSRLGVEDALERANLTGDGEQVLAGDAAVLEVGALAGDRLAVAGHAGRAQAHMVDAVRVALGCDLVLVVADRLHTQRLGPAGTLGQPVDERRERDLTGQVGRRADQLDPV